ncbi:MAG: GNAT family N-acetyltransferase [Anaerolineae bacterium]|nr:GNAT family N-acetyltransferase [Anaerolineae bacterium]
MTAPIRRLRNLDLAPLAPLLTESRAQGFNFIQRLWDDYADGSNRFDQPGARLLAAYEDERMIAIGGIQPDPYLAQGDAGRIRHVYVLDAYRRQGVGRALLAALIDHARGRFTLVTLRTFSAQAAAFYVALGFEATDTIPNVTHVMRL